MIDHIIHKQFYLVYPLTISSHDDFLLLLIWPCFSKVFPLLYLALCTCHKHKSIFTNIQTVIGCPHLEQGQNYPFPVALSNFLKKMQQTNIWMHLQLQRWWNIKVTIMWWAYYFDYYTLPAKPPFSKLKLLLKKLLIVPLGFKLKRWTISIQLGYFESQKRTKYTI